MINVWSESQAKLLRERLPKSGGGYAVQVLSQRNEEEVQSLTERKVQSVGGRSGGAGGED